MMFRTLRADEIECRVAQIIDNKGLSLLLYKDARCDQRILDETVGAMNWQNQYTRDNANCIVSIWDKDKGQWISKENTGTESYTEAQKGLASDSFKRACFNWGIGRELYTAPFIWIDANNCNIKTNAKGKLICKDIFKVAKFDVEDGKITTLIIVNGKTGAVVYSMNIPSSSPKLASKVDIELIENLAEEIGVEISKLEKKYKVKVISALTPEQARECINGLKGMITSG